MNNFYKVTLASVLGLAAMSGATAQATSRAYGIQVYSDSNPNQKAQLISFEVDNPKKVNIEADFGAYEIIAAACDGEAYYMLVSDGEIAPTNLVKYDMAHHTFSTVATYGYNDQASRMIVTDMTYDPQSSQFYLYGADLADAEIIDGEVEAHFGIFTLDKATGATNKVGTNEVAVFVAIACSGDEIWGADSEGNIWIINKRNGKPEDVIGQTGITAYGIQSMAYDFSDNTYYWASFSSEDGGESGISNLYAFELSEDYEVITSELGKIGDNAEVIGLYIDDNPIDPQAPKSVASLTVTPAANGKGEAVISWTNPSEAINGNKLSGTLSAKIFRDGKEVGTVNGTPGKQSSWTDKNVASATYTYSVTVTANGYTSAPEYATPIFVGVDIPGAPASVKAAATGEKYNVKVEWTAPEKGANGGWYDASDLHYCVTRYPDNKVMAADTKELSFTDTTIETQASYTYGVKAIHGSGFGPEAISNHVNIGAPIQVPYTMTLSEEDADLWTVFNEDGDEYEWYVYRDMWGGTTNPFFRYYPETTLNPQGKANDWLISPSFELKADKGYLISYDLRLLGDLFPANTSVWIGSKADPKEMTTLLGKFENETNDIVWEKHVLPVKVDKDGSYYIGFQVNNLSPVQLCNFTIKETEPIDLKVDNLTGPRSVPADVTTTFRVNVTNLGYKDVEKYTVTMSDEKGNVLVTNNVNETILAGTSATINMDWTPTKTGDYKLTASVSASGDADTDNDVSKPVEVTVISGDAWINVDEGEKDTMEVPFSTWARYSVSESVYPASMLNYNKPAKIKALTYNVVYNEFTESNTVNLEVYLGNTTVEEFATVNPKPVALKDMVKVFDGKINIDPKQNRLTLPLDDSSFLYSGGNLVIYTYMTSEKPLRKLIGFRALNNKELPCYSIYGLNDAEGLSLSSELIPASILPNVSILVEVPEGIKTINTDTSMISYDRLTKTVNISGDFSFCRVLTADGTLVATFIPGMEMKIPAMLKGVGMIEVMTPAGRSISKIIF